MWTTSKQNKTKEAATNISGLANLKKKNALYVYTTWEKFLIIYLFLNIFVQLDNNHFQGHYFEIRRGKEKEVHVKEGNCFNSQETYKFREDNDPRNHLGKFLPI